MHAEIYFRSGESIKLILVILRRAKVNEKKMCLEFHRLLCRVIEEYGHETEGMPDCIQNEGV